MNKDRELLNQVISDHNRNPYCYGELDEYNHFAEGDNPNRGDNVKIYLQIENDIIEKCGFTGDGGAAFVASASIMMELIEKKSIDSAKTSCNLFFSIFTDKEIDDDELGKLIVFKGIKKFPARIKCAGLPWLTMLGALNNSKETITTEHL